MSRKKPTIAIMYDFDKTLCTKDMQEYEFIPNLGVKPAQFWKEAKELAENNNMDMVLAYMYHMVRTSKNKYIPIKRMDFTQLGKGVSFFEGVLDWFIRINEFGKINGVNIEHYIISSGLKEIIEGSSIYKEFKKVYACEFHYDENGAADWPAMAVNYTGKTQFLFRINKGVLDISDNKTLNKYVPDDDRAVPFRNMIYIGDGLTDVPCMKLVKVNGGYSIAVYPSGKGKKQAVSELLKDDRVNFICSADYSAGQELEATVQSIIAKMSATDGLVRKNIKQRLEIMKSDK